MLVWYHFFSCRMYYFSVFVRLKIFSNTSLQFFILSTASPDVRSPSDALAATSSLDADRCAISSAMRPVLSTIPATICSLFWMLVLLSSVYSFLLCQPVPPVRLDAFRASNCTGWKILVMQCFIILNYSTRRQKGK